MSGVHSATKFESSGAGVSSEKQQGIDDVKRLKEITETILTYGKDGDYRKLQKILKKLRRDGLTDAEIVQGYRDSNKRNFLHFAAACGKLPAVTYVIEYIDKNAVNWTDAEGATALHLAGAGGHKKVIEYLLEHGANINAAKESGTTTLHLACQNGDEELVNFLIENGANVNAASEVGSPLHWATREGNVAIVSALLSSGAKVSERNSSGASSLALAVAIGNAPIVEVLVRSGADVRETVPGGLNMLHMASEIGHLDVVKLLLSNANETQVNEAIAAKSDGGLVAVQLAAAEGHTEIVDLLMSRSPFLHSKGVNTAELIATEKRRAQEAKAGLIQAKTAEVPLPVAPTDPEQLQQATVAKNRGNTAFITKKYEDALVEYTAAINLNPADEVFYCNRAACYLELGKPEEALKDLKLCKRLKPGWAKACYREGKAYEAVQNYEEASYSYWEGMREEPNNKTLKSSFQRVISLAREQNAEAPRS